MVNINIKNVSVIKNILGDFNIGKLTSDKTVSIFGVKLWKTHVEEHYDADSDLDKKKDGIGFKNKK